MAKITVDVQGQEGYRVDMKQTLYRLTTPDGTHLGLTALKPTGRYEAIVVNTVPAGASK